VGRIYGAGFEGEEVRIYYWIRFKFLQWNYKRKYGFDFDEAMKEYGRNVVLREKEDE
jgi:hypothetical protein